MRPISDTIQRLQRMQGAGMVPPVPDRLRDIVPPSRNPGNLRGRVHVPAGLAPGAALVVALHGCTQNAAAYDHGTGWSTLADREGFAVLFPEQQRANNPNMCFNWFEAADIARTGGEAESIAAMIDAVVATHRIDPARVFVTGLSAGGAMSAVMLATWPEKFAGGAIIGGLPYGGALGVPQALDRMRGHGAPADAAAVAAVRAAAIGGPRAPRVSLWHGSADTTVVVDNLDRLVGQWRGVHGLPPGPVEETRGRNWEHRVWRGTDGDALVEAWRIAGMGHGVPIDPASGIGAAGPFMLDVGLSSTLAIAGSWGLTGAAAAAAPRVEPVAAPAPRVPALAQAPAPRGRRLERMDEPRGDGGGSVQATIERALRAAGLMR
ncbi:extracellular catalytic domain type 1 short-chain-length polyhydroxyalkanoate depolymerase [Sphingomonas sp. VNH70]|uniref:extracellular catalytic domain type 1 short-chain-length polyhydroxyalkanoate depolymerase n=1 Tax=Sphingomonas silueang TaxID=3156617 RepID=UPI0032B578F2